MNMIHDIMNGKLDDLKSMPKDKLMSAINMAVLSMFAIEFLGTVGIYLALKHWASLMWAELWMLIAFGYMLKNELSLIESKIIDQIIKNDSNDSKEDNTQAASEGFTSN